MEVKVKTSPFYLASLGSRAEIEAGLIGARLGLYQRMLREISAQMVGFTTALMTRFERSRTELIQRGARFRFFRFAG